MTTMTHPVLKFADSRHHPLTTAVFVALFWLFAAAMMLTVRTEVGQREPLAAAAGEIAGVLIAAFAYTRLCARCAGTTHALGVGIAWLLLAVATEIIVTKEVGHAWFAMLGTPDRPLLRNVLLFVWIFGPVMFARSASPR